MDIIKSFSRRSLLWIFFVMVLLTILFGSTGFYLWQFFSSVLPLSLIQEVSVHSDSFKAGLEKLMPVTYLIKNFYIPFVSGIFIVFGLMLWLILRSIVLRLERKIGAKKIKTKKKGKKEYPDQDRDDLSETEKLAQQDSNKRFYLHLLTVLQREGRLIDFFSEDLSQYDDAQIGAAVRSIQESCKKSLKKYLKPKAILDSDEGETITVQSGFDPGIIKLTGNVTGEPPFKGILRHKGWRASKLELPTLLPGEDPTVIAPAEVEIL